MDMGLKYINYIMSLEESSWEGYGVPCVPWL
jgi:hypothetical protein